MSRHDLTLRGMIRAMTTPKAINIGPTVIDFGQQSGPRLSALARAGGAIQSAAVGGMAYAQMLSVSDFEQLKAFVAYADSEFALLGQVSRDDIPDRQVSDDGYGVMDRSKT